MNGDNCNENKWITPPALPIPQLKLQFSVGTFVLLCVLCSCLPLTLLGETLEKLMNETWWAFAAFVGHSGCLVLRAEGTDMTVWRIWEFVDPGQRILGKKKIGEKL